MSSSTAAGARKAKIEERSLDGLCLSVCVAVKKKTLAAYVCFRVYCTGRRRQVTTSPSCYKIRFNFHGVSCD